MNSNLIDNNVTATARDDLQLVRDLRFDSGEMIDAVDTDEEVGDFGNPLNILIALEEDDSGW